jgi:hypothetical protein
LANATACSFSIPSSSSRTGALLAWIDNIAARYHAHFRGNSLSRAGLAIAWRRRSPTTSIFVLAAYTGYHLFEMYVIVPRE